MQIIGVWIVIFYWFVIGLPGFAEINVSIAAKTIVGVGPSSVPIRIQTNEDGNIVL